MKYKYGAKNPFKELTIGLHAFSLTFMHPIDKVEMTIEAPRPEEWQLIN
jgi:23S rRNA-/tRNA-specific pseudouridylate synthase